MKEGKYRQEYIQIYKNGLIKRIIGLIPQQFVDKKEKKQFDNVDEEIGFIKEIEKTFYSTDTKPKSEEESKYMTYNPLGYAILKKFNYSGGFIAYFRPEFLGFDVFTYRTTNNPYLLNKVLRVF